MKVSIARDGFPFIGGGLLLTLLAGFILGGPGVIPTGLLTLFVIYFFRDPERNPQGDEKTVLSPADGKVLEVMELEESRYLQKRTKRVTIFLSVFNVHVNRAPLAGRIRSIRYQAGKFLFGFSSAASLENEQNAILLEGEGEVLFVQIAGFVARRIVCRVKEGDRLQRGERFGMIRFGSRMDVYLPLEAEVIVSRGARVRGGETPIARLP